MIVNRFFYRLGLNDYIFELYYMWKYYYFSIFEKMVVSLQIIFTLDSKYTSCGFSDRLMGLITSYALSKTLEIPFKIFHEIPYKFEDCFLPNIVDWKVKKDDMTYNLLFAHPIVVMNKSKGDRYRFHFSNKKQYHIYSNVGAVSLINKYYNKNFKYSELFKELFIPSP